MGCFFDFFVELIGSLVVEGFMSLSEAFVPNGLSKRMYETVRIIFCAVSAVLFFGIIIGIAVLIGSKGKSFLGWLPVILGAVYIVSGAVLGLKRSK